jgi:hypothetical protein
MSLYEAPELLQVGAVEEVVFGIKGGLEPDNDEPHTSSPQLGSVLDFD